MIPLNMSTTIFTILAGVCYLAGGLVIGMRLFSDRCAWQPARRVGIALGLAGVALHSIVLYQTMVTDSGLNLGVFIAASLAAWIIVLALMLSAISKPIENLGIVLLPLAALAMALELLFPSNLIFDASAPWGLRLHAVVSLMAYSLFTMAAVQAILLAIQDRHLHNRHPGGFIRSLPPLQTMEALLFEMIIIGFILLSIGLFSGFMFLENMFAQHLVHKTILSIVSWLVFSILLWGRLQFGWRGRTAIRWTLSGFVVLALAYFGSKAVIELIL
ncbi:Inner membrane protein YpjD [hydrothermal vent metagenome]|uniref:Inner membrane protein YpjD n=1 Tax=hydrothermal vent metagenome TaxID=652676 RepID=A0A3B1BNK7_9ZZZZ